MKINAKNKLLKQNESTYTNKKYNIINNQSNQY